LHLGLVIRSALCVMAIAVNFVLAGCQSSKKLDVESKAATRAPDSVLLRNKDANQNSKERDAASIKDEFMKAVKKGGGSSNQISQDDCEAITSKTQFRYSSPNKKGILVYPIDNALVPVDHLNSGKCSVLDSIVLDEEISKFTYSSDGDPLTKMISLWSLEQIEGCSDEFEYIPGCQALVNYKKVLFVGDQAKEEDQVKRNEYSVHYREPSGSWLAGDCRLVQGDDKFNCRRFYSLAPLKQYRKYIVSGSDKSFDIYMSNNSVILE